MFSTTITFQQFLIHSTLLYSDIVTYNQQLIYPNITILARKWLGGGKEKVPPSDGPPI